MYTWILNDIVQDGSCKTSQSQLSFEPTTSEKQLTGFADRADSAYISPRK